MPNDFLDDKSDDNSSAGSDQKEHAENENNENLFDKICQFARERNETELVKLVGTKIHINSIRKNFFTPESLLASQNNHDAVNFLLEKFHVDKKFIVMGYAVAGNHEKVKEYEAQEKIDPLAIALGYAYGKYHDHVKHYLKKGACADEVACVYAVLGDHPRVKKYADNGADLLRIARAYQEYGFVKEAEHCKELNEKRESEFHESLDKEFLYINYLKSKKAHIEYSRYKLRINLNSVSFGANKDAVSRILQDLISSFNGRPIDHFKYIKHSDEKAFDNDSEIKMEFDFWDLMKKGKENEAQDLARAMQGEKKIEYRQLCYKQLSVKEVHEKHELYTKLYQAYKDRFFSGAQYTLYIVDESDANELSLFMIKLERRLRAAELQIGKVTDSDLPISDKPTFTSLRQESFNDNKEYVSALESKETLLRLKDELVKSDFYQKVSKCVNEKAIANDFLPPIELVRAINKEISRFKEMKGSLTIGMGKKENKIQTALNNAMENLGEFKSIDDFMNFKKDNQLSIVEALKSPRKWVGSTPLWGNTDSWLNIKKQIEELGLDKTAMPIEFKSDASNIKNKN